MFVTFKDDDRIWQSVCVDRVYSVMSSIGKDKVCEIEFFQETDDNNIDAMVTFRFMDEDAFRCAARRIAKQIRKT